MSEYVSHVMLGSSVVVGFCASVAVLLLSWLILSCMALLVSIVRCWRYLRDGARVVCSFVRYGCSGHVLGAMAVFAEVRVAVAGLCACWWCASVCVGRLWVRRSVLMTCCLGSWPCDVDVYWDWSDVRSV